MSARVFVVQDQHRWDEAASRLVPKFDLSPAAAHGELVILLSPNCAPFNSAPVVRELREKLAGIQPGDHLLLTGNPVLIGMACSIASDILSRHGWPLMVLQWSGRNGCYISITIDGLGRRNDFAPRGPRA